MNSDELARELTDLVRPHLSTADRHHVLTTIAVGDDLLTGIQDEHDGGVDGEDVRV